MAYDDDLDAFEQRLTALENRVFGTAEKDADYPKEETLKKPCSDSLNDIESKINTALSTKKKAAMLYQKIPELTDMLDHSYTDELLLSDDAMADSIIAASGLLKRQAELLQQLQENEKHMNSEHIQGVVQHAGKLSTLNKIHISQQDEVSELTEESRQLIEGYNNLVSLMSKQFIIWDNALAKLEQKNKK